MHAEEVPVLEEQGHRVRVALDRSGEAVGANGTPEKMTMLDGFLEKGGRFSRRLPDGRQSSIYAVSGELTVRCQGAERSLMEGTATTVEAGAVTEIVLQSGRTSC